jgi:hypothetical protein
MLDEYYNFGKDYLDSIQKSIDTLKDNSKSPEEVIKTLRENVDDGAMSGYIVELLINNYDNIYSIRDGEVSKEGARYFAAVVDAEDDEEDENTSESTADTFDTAADGSATDSDDAAAMEARFEAEKESLDIEQDMSDDIDAAFASVASSAGSAFGNAAGNTSGDEEPQGSSTVFDSPASDAMTDIDSPF